MSPLPSSRVIPDGWDAHHRPVASATMTARCVINRITTGSYNSTTKQYGANIETPIYTGPCRIQQRTSAERATAFGEQQVTTRSYLVAIEWDAAEVLVDDVVTVTDATDPELATRTLRVTDVQYGSNQWQRDLYAEAFEG